MSVKLVKNFDFIKQLSQSSKRDCASLLQKVSIDRIKVLCEICLNLLEGNIPVNGEEKQKLKRHRKKIEVLADRKVALKQKRPIINQRGGFIGTLASVALPVLTGIIAKAVLKKKKKSKKKQK